MTVVLDATETAPQSPSPVAGAFRARPFLAPLPWLVPAALLVAALLDTGTPLRDIGLYTAYLLVGVVVPGTLVHRALRGSRGNVPEDVGFGAVTGLLLILIGWAGAAATGLQAYLWLWPLLIILPFLAVPGLWRNWRVTDPRPLPLRWSLIVAATLVLLVMANYPAWVQTPLPPATAIYYPDILYHLSLVHEMMRSMPFEVPQLAGDSLRYHYLSDADIAVGSMITGVSPATVLLRLWIVPVCAMSVLVTAALTRELSGKWWAGALGGATAILGVQLTLTGATEAFGSGTVSPNSPSLVYSIPLLGLLLSLAIDVVRGRPLRWAWLMIFPLGLACAGAKSSTLPPLVAGVALALVVMLFTARDKLLRMAGFFGLTLAAMGLGLKLFAGGGAGTLALQPFAVLAWMLPYQKTLGRDDVLSSTRGFLPTGVENATTAGWLFIVGLLVWWLLMQSPRLIGFLALGAKPTRSDPAAWLFAGVTLAGTGAAWAFWHPAASQLYFFVTVVPFGAVLSTWYLADRARSWRPVVLGLLAGGLYCAFVPDRGKAAGASLSGWMKALYEPVLYAAVTAAVVSIVGLVVWRLVSGRFAWRAVVVALVAAVLGGSVGTQLDNQIASNHSALTRPDTVARPTDRSLLEQEAAAALWLDDHAGSDDVVATNVHCWPITWTAACDARAFWVAGLGGRRTVVESWAYSDEAVAQDGVGGLRYNRQPAPDPARYALNERVFTKGDAADLAELKREFDVKWLVADSRDPDGVSPGLGKVAQLRYTSGPVTIYEVS